MIFLGVYTASQSPALSNSSANSETPGISIPNCNQWGRQAVPFAFTFWTNSAGMCEEVVTQNIQFQCHLHEKSSFFAMSLQPFAGWRERDGYFGWLQPSWCLLPAQKHQGMFGCFGWHLIQERITDFIVSPLKSEKKFTFALWILDKLQFYYICTQMLNPLPVQGCLSQSHAGRALKNCTPE